MLIYNAQKKLRQLIYTHNWSTVIKKLVHIHLKENLKALSKYFEK